MKLKSFFIKNVKSKTEIVKIKKPSHEQILFADTVLEIISPAMEAVGFVRHRTDIETFLTTIVFRKDKQYVKISGSTYPTDYPYSYNIMLGEGDSEIFLEWDWNSIPLWLLENKIAPTLTAKEYEFPIGVKVKSSITKAKDDLIELGESFLKGDLTAFKEILSQQNKERVAYKIYSPDTHGNYKTTDEPKSIKQKKKYS